MRADLIPPPVPPDAAVDEAAEILAKLSECDALHGWAATFRRDDLRHTGVWPSKFDCGSLGEIHAWVPEFLGDNVDPEHSWKQNLARCSLAIRQAVERRDLDLELLSEALDRGDARKAVR